MIAIAALTPHVAHFRCPPFIDHDKGDQRLVRDCRCNVRRDSLAAAARNSRGVPPRQNGRPGLELLAVDEALTSWDPYVRLNLTGSAADDTSHLLLCCTTKTWCWFEWMAFLFLQEMWFGIAERAVCDLRKFAAENIGYHVLAVAEYPELFSSVLTACEVRHAPGELTLFRLL